VKNARKQVSLSLSLSLSSAKSSSVDRKGLFVTKIKVHANKNISMINM
jgi:hypothetical protein